MAPKKKKATKEEILQKKREAERKRYAKIKNDPQKREELREKERLKYLKKKEKGTRKLVENMTPREHRDAKKKWKQHCTKYRSKKKVLANITNSFIKENTPDSDVSASCQMEVAERNNKNKEKMLRYKIKKKKDEEIKELKRKVLKYKKRLSRLKKSTNPKPTDTPNTKLQKMADNPESRKDLVKKALFGEVLKQQIEDNFSEMKTVKEKRLLTKMVTGKIVDKYKLWRMKNTGVISYKRIKKAKIGHRLERRKKISDKCVRAVVNFYEDDSNSRLGAGKKEFITRKSERKQKRYMLDSLLGLYEKFKLEKRNFTLSYQTFCKLRPFWIVMPKVDKRDTCLCINHANIDLKVSALFNAKILNYNSYQKLLQELCCDRYNEKCLSRDCQKCFNNNPFYKEFNNMRRINYKKWISEKADFIDPKSKKTRRVTKYVKKSFDVKPRDLIIELQDELETFLRHERNIVHQFSAIKKLKSMLTEEDALIHMDFSENYITKYSQEIQAFHFGGSRTQISLHTVVVYLKDTTKSYCTISTNVSHSPAAIWAHLNPIFNALPPQIKHLHFLSDGPVTQYRNKTMFYIMATKISKRFPYVQNFTWNYTESGHGKGAPDGVGATCKRTADALVATGGDVENLEKFVEAIEKRCPAISLSIIPDEAIEEMSTEIDREVTKMKTFVGTLKVHQVTGKFFNPTGIKSNSTEIVMKTLSCFCDNDYCVHFNIGKIIYEDKPKLNVEDVYTDSESDNEAGPSSAVVQPFKTGDYIVVKLLSKTNMEYRYVSIIDKIDEEDGEIRVTFLKLCDNKGQLFRYDADDVSDITMDQVVQKLSNPNIVLKGNRIFYKFDLPVDVFEKK
ncbi:uncharacterized protein LOC111353248 [Spodoptera litura]|uniref:Uncharacterized protein LOC111351351 n=1 Tax=Spodoptera litura TaxID=69820 RepID=A0A9J7DY90_SPOLT|nr:uncharacterized protein LOC111351351 [Spodoptera litura]XP_022821964.1 uncharacterized protein LOC111353248 [Spodoptera litura]